MSSFDERFDFVIVGSGGGSMCAALYLRAHGKSVLILEKDSCVGGTTARSGGVMWIPCNPFLRRDGIEDSEEQALLYLDSLAAQYPPAPGGTPERRRTYVREAPLMVEFLLSQGIKLNRARYWPDYYDELPGGLECGRSVVADLFDLKELGEWENRLRPGFMEMAASLEEMLALPYFKHSWRSRKALLKVLGRSLLARLGGKRLVSAGAALQGRMLQMALRKEVDIRSGSPVAELLVEGGRVAGVATVRDGKPWRVAGTLGVLVNAGGFSRNQRMRDTYLPGSSAQWSSAAPCDTGEMIEEMARHGAWLAQMGEVIGHQCTLPPGTRYEDVKQGIQSVTAKPHAILVDRSGVRFMNEGGSYMAYCKGMWERNREVPAVPGWAIFDSQFVGRYMLAGTLPGSRKPAEWYEKRYLRKADSLDDLAVSIGVDAGVLNSTVQRFNGFCDSGRDADFSRGERAYDRWLGDPTREGIARTLGKIEKGPFYAVEVYPGDVGTCGGVVTDSDARVLAEDGSVIDGLYATGVSTASVMGYTYPGAGASVGPSFTWGFVAAKHAVSTA